MAKVEITTQKGHNFLWVDEYLWMWDIPAEVKAQKELADQAYGDVLVAGYGLGILQRCLVDNPKVTSIISVEKYQEVIDLCEEKYGQIYGGYLIADFLDNNCMGNFYQYDCVLGDIWDEIIPSNLPVFQKFKRKAQEFIKPDGKIIAWGLGYFEWLESKVS